MSAGRQDALGLAALGLATLGLCLTAWSWRALGDANRIHETRLQTLAELRSLQAESSRDREGFHAFERLVATNRPAALVAAAATIAPTAQLGLGAEKTEKLAGDWVLRRVDVDLAEIALHDAGRFVEYLESQRPPWRLVACDITATGPAQGHVKLTLETISR